MQWIKPDFQEISLGMEVTAYVNTDPVLKLDEPPARSETSVPATDPAVEKPA